MNARNLSKKVTIKDIAKRCNVSAQTVSRVVNQRPDVAPATRAAIEKAIAELGYQPSALARSLVHQRSRTLGVITAGLKYVGISLTLHGITAQCEASGYSLLLTELSQFRPGKLQPLIDSLMAHHVEGIIIFATEFDGNFDATAVELPMTSTPIVVLKHRINPNFTTVGVDNYGGGRAATDYLVAQGYKHIGLISGPLDWPEAVERKRGWEDALRAAGRPVDVHAWVEGTWSSASGERALAALVVANPELDAVFASNDQMALGALHYANTHGIAVPEQLAVIGFDNMTESAHFSPALTTIQQPLRELGILAVKTILAEIDGAEPPHDNVLTLDTELIVRDSA